MEFVINLEVDDEFFPSLKEIPVHQKVNICDIRDRFVQNVTRVTVLRKKN